MAMDTDKLLADIRALPQEEKLRLIDALLTELDVPDSQIDRVWAGEARKRWEAYKEGKLGTVAYDDLIKRYKT